MEAKDVNELTDQSVLVDIFYNAENYGTRTIAIQKLTDQSMLTEIANSVVMTDRTYIDGVVKSFRVLAAEMLTDQAVTQEVYTDIINKSLNGYDGYDDFMCYEAALNLSDTVFAQKAFAYAAIESTGDFHRKVVEKLTDQSLLAEVAINHKHDRSNNQFSNLDAVRKLTDQIAIANVAINAKDVSTCQIAIEKLTDLSVLNDIANGKYSIYTKSNAKDRLAELQGK